MCGPFSTEFQFQAVSDCQLVQPSQCLLVKTIYLYSGVGSIHALRRSPIQVVGVTLIIEMCGYDIPFIKVIV